MISRPAIPSRASSSSASWRTRPIALAVEITPPPPVEDFLKHRPSTGAGKVVPTYLPSVRWCDLHGCLPPFVCEALEEGIPMLGKKLKGFDSPDAILTAVETRSSSPVRIVRDSLSFQSALRGLYPCGEGAGYAGGITSAALDGMLTAEAIINELSNLKG